jgi:4-diphosphocytidyl-2-C-methyl-D-erythritol kinase
VRLRALAPAKVNLCLFLGGLRADGRHELVTLFESVSLADEVELSAGPGVGDHVVCQGVEEPNIVTRALALLRDQGWDAPSVEVTIDKRIPVAGGMGGGSADAAAVLRIASQVSPVSAAALTRIAAALGADVPSQLEPGIVLGTGAGDQVRPVAPRLPHAIVVVPQLPGLRTAEVYRRADELGLPRSDPELDRLRTDVASALESGSGLPPRLVVNDLEPAAISLLPGVAAARDAVRATGADHALVCGSGPTVAGLYWGEDGRARAGDAAAQLSEAYPEACVELPVERGHGAPVFA